MPDLQPLLGHLDGQIRKTLRGPRHLLKWKKAYDGLPGRLDLELLACDVSVNLVLFAGAQFDPPPPLGEGSRHVQIRTLEEARAPDAVRWIKQAGQRPGWQWPDRSG